MSENLEASVPGRVESVPRRRGPVALINRLVDWTAHHTSRSRVLRILERLSHATILVAVLVYFLGAEQRERQRIALAWQVIYQAAGHGGDGGRADALSTLHREGRSLSNVDLAGAYLPRLDLPRAILSGADLRGVELSHANLRDARLGTAKLQGAVLDNANLSEAGLREVDLSTTRLFRADLRGADLRGAILPGVGAAEGNEWLLKEARFDGARLKGAHASDADLRGALGLAEGQILELACWNDSTEFPGGLAPLVAERSCGEDHRRPSEADE